MVVKCEPQWKPSVEDQAIARCHRSGQVRPVRVHRLLTEHAVDAQMLDLLARKSALFDRYVRDSTIAHATAAAVDTELSEPKAAELIIAAERDRLGVADRPEQLSATRKLTGDEPHGDDAAT